jgi:ribokinase
MSIAVIGGINVDIVALADRYPEFGQTVIASDMRMSGGGKGATIAACCAKLGKTVRLIGCIGDDLNGQKVLGDLRSFGVDISRVKKLEGVLSGTAMVTLDRSATNTILVFPGANAYLTVDYLEQVQKIIADCKILLVSMETPVNVALKAISIAKQNGVMTIVDPGPADLISIEVAKECDLLLPNLQEAGALIGAQVRGAEDVEDACRLLAGMGINNVIMKMGERGAYISAQGVKQFIEAVPVEVVDTTGAGDSYAGALAVLLSEGKSIVEAARFASVVSALKVTRFGSLPGLPNLDEVMKAVSKQTKLLGD